MDSFPRGSNDPSGGAGSWGAGAAQLKRKSRKIPAYQALGGKT
jgi:hypothetical protein